MKIDLLNIYSFILCCVLPYVVIMTLLLARTIRARLKYRNQILAEISKASEDNLLPVPRPYLLVYVIVSITILASLICTTIVMFAYYLDLPVVSAIDSETLGIISLMVLLIAIVTTFIWMIFNKRYESKG